MNEATRRWQELDHRHLWHPFTQMRDWCAQEALVLVEGRGATLRDSEGREYLDGNSSIWANLHGHRHPRLDAALHEQIGKIAHTSFLGYTNPPAIELARELIALWDRPEALGPKLTRVFYSDNGSTAMEAALKMAIQYRQHRGEEERRRFIAFTGAYHGDTMGASSLGGINTFHERFAGYQFPVDHVASLEELEARCAGEGEPIEPQQVAAVVIEPLVQGAAGMHFWPPGMLRALREWCDRHGVHLIADEVMTGFGRTGTMFASEQEGVTPDFVALAKGISGGYFPLAATLTSEAVYEAFLGRYEELKSFFYGHTYTGNQLGCALGLASLAIFREERVLERLQGSAAVLGRELERLQGYPHVRNVRQLGMIAAFEIVQADGTSFPWQEQRGNRLCRAAWKYGLITRPVRDTIVLMPPYCITEEELARCVEALRLALEEMTATSFTSTR